MSSRDSRIDNAKGVLIILVVLGHLVWPVPNADRWADAFYYLAYFFHMPMFALISGYLSRADGGRHGVVKSAKQLLAPYVIFVGIQWFLMTRLGLEPSPLHEGHYGLWFLLSLFCWRAVLPYVVRMPYALPASICVALACGFVPFIGMELSLSRTIVLLPFFLAGHMMRQRGRGPVAFFGKPLAMALLAGGILLAVFLADFDFQSMFYGNGSYVRLGPAEGVGLVARVAQYCLAFSIGLAVLSLVPKGEGVLTRIGRHSLHVYLLHSLLLVLYRAWPTGYTVLGSNALLLIPAAIAVSWFLSTELVVRATARLVSPLSPIK